jgi:hypothetical protein
MAGAGFSNKGSMGIGDWGLGKFILDATMLH